MGVSQREKGNMKGCSLLLLLHTCAISGVLGGTTVAGGSRLTKISSLTGIVDIPVNHKGRNQSWVAVAVGLDPIEISPLTGIVDLLSSIEGISSPTDACLKPFSCKRPSLRNRKKMICCLPVNRRGRSRCPNSCD